MGKKGGRKSEKTKNVEGLPGDKAVSKERVVGERNPEASQRNKEI